LPHKRWLWDGRGFYDNRPGKWASHPGTELVSYAEFKRRMRVAAAENCEHQDATELSFDEMKAVRDKENCFRIVELGIPKGADVTVLAKPVWSKASQSITLLAPDPPKSPDHMRFMFRIMKGHTIDTLANLLKHRAGALKVYLGFAAMGAITILCGEEMLRDGVVFSVS